MKHMNALLHLVGQGTAAAAQPGCLLPQPRIGDGLEDCRLGAAVAPPNKRERHRRRFPAATG